MKKQKLEEITAQIVFFIVSAYILLKIFIPILNPVKTAADLNYNQDYFYKQILNKASASMEVVDNSYEDEDKKELLQLIFKYLTNIDISNPKTYIASQIPILQYMDLSTILSNESGPVVVIPTEDTKVPQPSVTTIPTIVASGDVNNDNTSAKPIDPNEAGTVPKKTLNPAKPVILIFHTHTTEAYNPDRKDDKNFSLQLVDGVCTVGEELKKELENKYGIATIHDMTIHDYPIREGGYKKARPTISSYLKKYPSIKLVIDLHRDGGLKRNSSTALIKNETYARTMFVIGTKNKNRAKNEAFAKKLNGILESQYPGFSKGLYYESAVYNEDLFSNMALLEIGSDINSVQEAIRTSKIIAKVLAIDLK